MADIELIVKIPEEKIVIEYGKVISIGRNNDKELADYIFAGTPLTGSDDCVSREDVLKGRTYTSTEEGWEGYTIDEDYVKSLPSVQPAREKHDEEIIAETVASVWGKPPYTEVLDKITAEIERYQADCDLSCSDDANCRTCDRITFDSIYRIIDKYRKGQTDADSD